MIEPVDLLLASKSPRRRELLSQIGVRHRPITVDVPEVYEPGEDARAYVGRLALAKAKAGAALQPGVPVLGADTVVVYQDRVLEKPADKTAGLKMLALLSGTTHTVVTAVALCLGQREAQCWCETRVTFRIISPIEAEAYWLTGEPQDKAGGYGIQGFGAVFVSHMEGSYSNVVGLPLAETHQLLQRFEVPVWRGSCE